MRRLLQILQTLLGCNHVPGVWFLGSDGIVWYLCKKCWKPVASSMVLDLPIPNRTQEAKPEAVPCVVETAIEKRERAGWLADCGVKTD